ncbi:MAG: glycoside hydrolase family 2 TIM barrel-domain containing protein [Nocardioides sp.]
MKIISLAGQSWQLKGFWPWVPLQGRSMETAAELMGVTDWLPATVPGGVHFDLHRAGLLPHPHVDVQSLAGEWVENRWWLYRTTLERPAETGDRIELHFCGLDYEANIFVDDRLLGEHRGMFHPATFDLTAAFAERERLELKVLFRGVPPEMGQIGRTSLTSTQKSRFGYKWDFATRLVNIGFWDEVQLRVHRRASLTTLAIDTDVADGEGILNVAAELMRVAQSGAVEEFAVELADPEGRVLRSERVRIDAGTTTARCTLRVAAPQLWQPNGHGAQPLYALTLALCVDGERVDERRRRIGFRRLRYEQNPGGPPDALPYTIVVNGTRLYVQGVNLTPLDHLYGNVTTEHYEWVVRCMRDANVNLVRVWGGGVIEQERFYDLCDRYGILVWQEFIQSSSGVDNIPSQRPEFLALLRQTAEAALRERGNHTCLAVWSGGNELMDADNVPSTLADPNLAMLRDLVQRHDPGRLFLPTSASGLVEHMTTRRGVMHDVHGHWKYVGPRDHYALYGESDSLFHSEFGVDGCSSSRSLGKFLSAPHLRPTDVKRSLVWRHHAEWWDTAERDRGFFGLADDIELFTECSQWIQAEGLRFILEANRRRQPRNSGSIIWQLNEPWPNISCTNLVDYYGEKKMAYYWARKAFASLHASLDYRRLSFAVGERFEGTVHLHNSGSAGEVTLTLEVLTPSGAALERREWKRPVDGNASVLVAAIAFEVQPAHAEMFFVRLHWRRGGAPMQENTYVFSTRVAELYAPARQLVASDLVATARGDWVPTDGDGWQRVFAVENRGADVALFVRPEEITDAWWLEAEWAFEPLFPGERRAVTVRCFPKQAGGFLADERAPRGARPEIHFRAWQTPGVPFVSAAEKS